MAYATREEALLDMKDYCARMRLKATHLPCGERVECFRYGRCSRVPKDAPQVEETWGKRLFRWGFRSFS